MKDNNNNENPANKNSNNARNNPVFNERINLSTNNTSKSDLKISLNTQTEYLNGLKESSLLLKNIGNKLSDFKEIPNKGKQYFLLGCHNFGYVEKMISKINNNYYAIKKFINIQIHLK